MNSIRALSTWSVRVTNTGNVVPVRPRQSSPAAKTPPQRAASAAAQHKADSAAAVRAAASAQVPPPPGSSLGQAPAPQIHIALPKAAFPAFQGGAAARPQNGGRRRRCGCKGLAKWCKRLFTFAAWLPLASLLMPGIGLGAAALLAGLGDLSGAAGQFAAAGANVTTAVASIAVASSAGAISAAEEAWSGVDLLDLRVDAECGAVMLDDVADFRMLVDSPAGELLFKVPEPLRNLALGAIEQATISTPALDFSKAHLNISGLYYQLRISIALLPSCSWALRWQFAHVDFSPRWANPVWTLAASRIDAQEGQIREKIAKVLSQHADTLFPETSSALSPISSSEVAIPRRFKRLCRRVLKLLRQIWAQFS